MRIKEAIEKYLEDFKRKRSPLTALEKEVNLKAFREFMQNKGIENIEEVLKTHIADYQRYRAEYKNRYGRTDQPGVQNRYLQIVQLFFRYARREGILVNDPSEGIDFLRVPKRLPKAALTYGEMVKLLKQVDDGTNIGYRNRTILELFYSCGLRKQELLDLRLQDIQGEEALIRVKGKGDKERIVPAGKMALKYLETYVRHIRPECLKGREEEKLFVSSNGKPIGRGALETMLKKYHHLSGLEKKVTTHTFRRSCATGMIRNHANVMHVRALLGHSSISAIQSYVDLTIHDLKKEHRKTHPREKNQN